MWKSPRAYVSKCGPPSRSARCLYQRLEGCYDSQGQWENGGALGTPAQMSPAVTPEASGPLGKTPNLLAYVQASSVHRQGPLTLEGFPLTASSHSSRCTTCSLLPNSCSDKEKRIYVINSLHFSLSLHFFSPLHQSVAPQICPSVSEPTPCPQAKTSFHWRRRACWNASPYQVKQLKKKPQTASTPCFCPKEETLALFISEQHQLFSSSLAKTRVFLLNN